MIEHLSVSVIMKVIGFALKVPKMLSQFQANDAVEIELKKTFEETLESWSVNTKIRESKRESLIRKLQEYSESEKEIDLSKDIELQKFLELYKKKLSANSIAYNYLSSQEITAKSKNILSNQDLFFNEFKDIKQKLEELAQSSSSSVNEKLVKDWLVQINIYKKSIEEFKPKTALDYLIKLEERCKSNDVKPSNELFGTIEFLKAQCYQMMNLPVEMYDSSIRAFELNSNPLSFMERACYAFSKTNKIDKALILVQKLLEIDEINPTAFAVKVILSNEKKLETRLLNIPTKVLRNTHFKRIIYFNTYTNPDFPDAIDIYERFGLYPNEEIFKLDSPITVENYKNWYFLIETSLTRLFRQTYFNSEIIKTEKNDLLEFTDTLLKRYIKQISNSEMDFALKELKFFSCYTDYTLYGKTDSIATMKYLFSKIEDNNPTIVLLMTSILQSNNRLEEAIEILNTQDNQNLNILQLKSYCQYKKQDFENYVTTIKHLLPLIHNVDDNNCERILNVIYGLSIIDKLNEINEIQFTESKNFESDYFEVLINCFLRVLKGEEIEIQITRLQSIEELVLNSKTSLRYYIPFSYYLIEEYALAIENFEKYVSYDEPSRDLHYFILSLFRSNSNHVKLRSILKKWRTNFYFSDQLLRIEADIAMQLTDWKRGLKISEHYLNKNSKDEYFLTLELVCLNELNPPKKAKRIEELSIIFKDFNFRDYANVQAVSKILVENNYPQIGLDLVYTYAKDKSNIQARMDYFFITTRIPSGIIQEMEIVDVDCYVKYLLKDETIFLKIKKGNDLSDKFIGKGKGAFVKMENPMTGDVDSIQVIRIMDKYLCLHDEILEEVKNPYSGLPIQSFNFEDNSLEGMNETFIKLFGAKGTVLRDEKEINFASYYNYELSFTELIIRSYSSDYLGGYFNLIAHKDGFTQVPIMYYPDNMSLKGKEFVIDLGSLFMLYKITQDYEYEFESKFLIANGNVEFLRNQLKKEKAQPKERMSLDITMDGVNPYVVPENAIQSNITFLNNILIWIDLNCTTTIVESKLDLLKKFEREVDGIFGNIILENISLTNESTNRILISDDSFYFKLFPVLGGKTVSTEKYMSVFFSINREWEKSFVDSKYVGFTMNLQIIYDEFIKQITSKPNAYEFCITNTSLRLIPNNQTIFTIVKFLRKIALNPIVGDIQFSQEATKAFVNLLKNQKKLEAYKLTNKSIEEEFKYLGTKLDLVLESYYNALFILGKS